MTDLSNINVTGFPTTVWGPVIWTSMHIIANTYPVNPTEDHKKAAKNYYESLVFLLPCAICQKHYKDILVSNPIQDSLVSRSELNKWVFTIHNIVNKQLNKVEHTMEQHADDMKKLALLRELSIGKLHVVYWNGSNWMEVYK